MAKARPPQGDSAPPEESPTETPPVDAPVVTHASDTAPRDSAPPEESFKRDALRFVAALVHMREAVQRIHAAQVDGVDGTSAAGAFCGALLALGGRISEYPPRAWHLKQLLDKPTHPSTDPQRNVAARALVDYLFECLEHGRKKPGEGEEELARFAEHWPSFRHRAEAVRFESQIAEDAHRDREHAAAAEHHQRLSKTAPTAARRAPRPEPIEVSEPPDETVG